MSERAILAYLNGPQTLGKGRGFWTAFLVVCLAAVLYPIFADPYAVGNLAYFALWLFMAMGLSIMWGYGGILSFGQTFFFGIGGYGYGVLSILMGAQYGMPLLALVLAIGLAILNAIAFGYLMIYGRVTGVFFGIMTLSMTLALAYFLGQTAGPEWAIGSARLNGFNGMQGMPPLTLPWFGGGIELFDRALYYFVLVLLLIVYLAARMFLNSPLGHVLVAVREDPERAELLGYDIRKYQMMAFVVGSALAALSGGLYTAWGQFITPTSIGLPAAAMPIVWVAFAGRKDITATTVGTFVFLLAYQTITIYSQQWALILTGGLLLATVMFVPDGFVLGLFKAIGRLFRKQNSSPSGTRHLMRGKQ